VAPRASRRSPWVAASGSGFFLCNRALVPLALGPEFGGYLIRRVRLTGRLAVPVLRGDDLCAREDVIYANEQGVFTCLPSLELGLSAGLGQTVRGSCRNHVVAPFAIGAVRPLPNVTTWSAFLGLSVGWTLGTDRR
jgi:hypothetical protein